ncbi:MAG: hypothetical protein E6L09_14690 [Verrucomicrobia bacterium]|nr:MAG: hypothetical protein E6L09_14690 [Verrucomicrobiota bacterium]
MLSQKRPLDDDDVIEVYERELEEGVHIDRPDIEEDSSQQMLGGLIRAEEHVSVHELPTRRSKKSV